MKLTLSKLNIAVILLVLAVGCKKNIDQQPAQVDAQMISKESLELSSIEVRRAYLQENFKVITRILGQVIKEPGFRELVHTEAEKKFDGDYNVLLNTLLSNPDYGPRLNSERMKKALEAFQGIEGQNFYPQIYIPRLRKRQERNAEGTASKMSSNSPITFVFYDGDESKIEFPGYTFNSTGEVVPSGMTVNEEYALNNEVYVVSLNESVNSEGLLSEAAKRAMSVKAGERATNTAAASRMMAPVNFMIDLIYLKTGKESWVAGASEVNIKSQASTWNHRNNGIATEPIRTYTTQRYVDNTSNYEGYQIVKADRNEIKFYWPSYSLNTNWAVDNFYSDPIAYTYVIFEYDAWPAAVRTAASLIPSNPEASTNKDFLNFRSSDGPYGGEVAGFDSYTNYAIYGNVSGLPSSLHHLYYNGHYYNTSSMELSTKAY